MKVIVPQTIGEDELISSTADDPPATWSGATVYDEGDLVSTNSGTKYWEAKYGEIEGSLCYHGLTLESTQVPLTRSGNTFIANNVDIGAAGVNRLIVVAIASGSGQFTLTGITIGGTSARMCVSTSGVTTEGVTAAIASLMVTTGTTANIIASSSTTLTASDRAYAEVYSLYGGTAIETDTDKGNIYDDETGTITPNDGDIIIGVGLANRNDTHAFSIDDCTTDSTKLTYTLEDYYYYAVSGTATSGAAKDIEIDGGPINTQNAYVAASFTLADADQVNQNKTPGVDKTLDSTCFAEATRDDDWWVEFFATGSGSSANEYRMFNEKIGEATRNLNSIVVEIMPPDVGNGLAFLGVDAASIQVEFYNSSGTRTYNETKNTAYTSALYSKIDAAATLVFDDLPDYDPDDYSSYTGDGPIVITITKTGEVAACGACVFGECVEVGGALYGTEVGIEDYSRKEFDTFGRPYIIEREYADNARYEIAVNTDEIGQIKRFLASLRAIPVVYIGNSDVEESVVYGFFSGLEFPIEEYGISVATLDVTGLV